MEVTWLKNFIDIVFASGLFVNALLFIPQAIRIFRKKEAKDLSLTTFAGFAITQISAVFYGYLNSDHILIVGYLLSFITCGIVTFQIMFYRLREYTAKVKLQNNILSSNPK